MVSSPKASRGLRPVFVEQVFRFLHPDGGEPMMTSGRILSKTDKPADE